MQLSDVVRIALIFSEDAKRYAKKLAGSIDLSGKADKKKPSKAGNLAALDANGNLADSGKAGANVAVKAKPSKAGNLAALTAPCPIPGLTRLPKPTCRTARPKPPRWQSRSRSIKRL